MTDDEKENSKLERILKERQQGFEVLTPQDIDASEAFQNALAKWNKKTWSDIGRTKGENK